MNIHWSSSGQQSFQNGLMLLNNSGCCQLLFIINLISYITSDLIENVENIQYFKYLLTFMTFINCELVTYW
jgi:hypothetical protein